MGGLNVKIKKIISTIMCVVLVTALSGCEFVDTAVEEAKKDSEWTKENNAFTDGAGAGNDSTESVSNKREVGETASFTVEDGSMDVTVTDWGSVWSDYHEQNIVYFNAEFNNTGTTAISITPGLFSVYADDYAVELAYTESDVLQTTSLDAGRKAKGKIYAVADADNVGTIEVQLANTVWTLKDGASAGTVDVDLPLDLMADDNQIDNLSGAYSSLFSASTMDFSLESSSVGYADIYLADDLDSPYANNSYSGEISEVQNNVYVLQSGEDTVIISFYSEATDEEKTVYGMVYVNGDTVDCYYLD
jgi:hypothetical protein